MFSNSFGLSLMSEGSPTCRQCEGKFGSAVGDNYCPLCSQLVQLAGHLLSRRFPVAKGQAAVHILRDTYLRVLELSEAYWGSREVTEFSTGCDLPLPVASKDKEERPDKSWQVKEERRDKSLSGEAPGLSGKAAPVKPPSYREELPRSPEEERSEEPQGSRGQSVGRGRSQSHQKKRRKKSKSGRHRSRSRRRRRKDSGREKEDSPRPKVETEEKREEVKDRRSFPGPSSAGAGAVRRARTPSHSPPRRDFSGYYQHPIWEGPILARTSGGDREPRGKSPKYINKGVKKRQQQERAKGKGGWGRGSRRY